MEGAQLFPTEAGAPQGGVRSPWLANVALHGLETAIETAFPTDKDRRRWKPTGVRYADDFVVLQRDREVIVQAQAIASTWLQGMGVALKPRNTRMAHTRQPIEGVAGFDCLGFHIRQYPVGQDKTGTTGQGKPLGCKTPIKPSTEAQHRHLLQITGELRKLRAASQEVLIGTLNPLIQGWSHYDSAVVAKATFRRMDTLVYAKLRRWAHRRHPKKSSWWVSEQDWHLREGHGTFKTDRGNTLRRHADTPIRRQTKVTGARSPYDGDWIYWATSMGKHPETSKRGAYLLKRQQGRCFWCGLYFTHGDDLGALDHIQPRSQGGDGSYGHRQLLHGHGHADKTANEQAG